MTRLFLHFWNVA